MRAWRKKLFAAAPPQCSEGGLRPLMSLLEDPDEAELLAQAKTAGLDLGVRAVWPQRDGCGASDTSLGCYEPADPRLAGRLEIEVPAATPSTMRHADPGMELHALLVGKLGSEADALASRVAWAAAEACWAPPPPHQRADAPADA